MIKLEDDCVGCPPEMGCIGSACRYSNVPHLYCDHCEEEVEELYEWGVGQEDHLCEKCLLQKFKKINPFE